MPLLEGKWEDSKKTMLDRICILTEKMYKDLDAFCISARKQKQCSLICSLRKLRLYRGSRRYLVKLFKREE